MAEGRRLDKVVSNIKSSILAQTAGFLFWPLLTVILVVGTLYYERVRDLEETTARKEMLLLKTAGQLLRSGSASVASDMLAVVESTALRRYLNEEDAASFSAVSSLLYEISNHNSAYGGLFIFNGNGGLLFSVTGQAEKTASPSALTAGEEPQLLDAAILDQPSGLLSCYLPSAEISTTERNKLSAPSLRFAALLKEPQHYECHHLSSESPWPAFLVQHGFPNSVF